FMNRPPRFPSRGGGVDACWCARPSEETACRVPPEPGHIRTTGAVSPATPFFSSNAVLTHAIPRQPTDADLGERHEAAARRHALDPARCDGVPACAVRLIVEPVVQDDDNESCGSRSGRRPRPLSRRARVHVKQTVPEPAPFVFVWLERRASRFP